MNLIYLKGLSVLLCFNLITTNHVQLLLLTLFQIKFWIVSRLFLKSFITVMLLLCGNAVGCNSYCTKKKKKLSVVGEQYWQQQSVNN